MVSIVGDGEARGGSGGRLVGMRIVGPGPVSRAAALVSATKRTICSAFIIVIRSLGTSKGVERNISEKGIIHSEEEREREEDTHARGHAEESL